MTMAPFTADGQNIRSFIQKLASALKTPSVNTTRLDLPELWHEYDYKIAIEEGATISQNRYSAFGADMKLKMLVPSGLFLLRSFLYCRLALHSPNRDERQDRFNINDYSTCGNAIIPLTRLSDTSGQDSESVSKTSKGFRVGTLYNNCFWCFSFMFFIRTRF